jgi:uncharacterized protein YidB (DUF937 family)
MGFLDNIMNAARTITQEQGQAAGQAQPQQHGSLVDGLVDMFRTDGAHNVIDRFRQQGLGDLVSSWIGTGSNRPISADQVRSALGPERIRQLAQRAGITEDRVPDFLKDLLPNMVDRATPGGSVDPDDSGQK